MARTSVVQQLEKLRKEREALELREKMLLERVNERALAKIALIAKQSGLSPQDITMALQSDSNGQARPRRQATSRNGPRSPAPAKYFNPEQPEQTWSGRGRPPPWARALKEAGKLELARVPEGILL